MEAAVMGWLEALEEILEERFVTRQQFNALRRMVVTDVNALVTQVQNIGAELEAAKQQLQTELDNLANAQPSVDLSGLQAAVDSVDAQAQALGGLQPTPPDDPSAAAGPTPDPSTDPSATQ
jgi:hypothetical protein